MPEKLFTRYETLVIAIVALVQFTIIVDFMVLSPLGVILMPALHITPQQFGMVVSAYAVSAGISGLLAAGFADKYDRKKMMLFFYIGFVGGTLLCGIATSYEFLLIARIVTGIFGGVVGSIGYAIVTDIFKPEVRGRVMGFVQMAFAGSQVLGLPIAIFLAPRLGWHAVFFMIVGAGVIITALIAFGLKPVDGHLQIKNDRNAFHHLWKTLTNKSYFRGFAATTLLATGGFMLMPFGSTFSQFNLGIDQKLLWVLYLVTGIFSMATGPFIGKFSDTMGKYAVFCAGSIVSSIVVIIYCNLGVTPLWGVIVISIIMFAGISSRMISSSALMTAIPSPADRGAFMSINASSQYLAGGFATFVAGLIIVQRTETSPLENFDILGYTVVGSMVVTMIMMYSIHQYVTAKTQPQSQPA
jgi:predicted MFS family arabinose efflux permease